ncbi:MAG TPA: hypothetical protein VG097_13790 [Gemmata sp.]|jgi:hypothetical protein|nr:hypothetical protein [Gemmata sp.]
MMAARPGRWIVFTAILAVIGCSESDQVRIHDEIPPPKPVVPPISAEQKLFRTLAAMVPVDGKESWWFLKMTGPIAVIGKYEADFDKLFNSLLAKEDEINPISWELPTGWTQEIAPPGAMRFATLKSPGGEIEITVTKFGGSVLANAQRWWGELWGKEKGLTLTDAMLPEYIQQRTVKGRLILRVDMSGPNEPPKRPMMPNPHGGK